MKEDDKIIIGKVKRAFHETFESICDSNDISEALLWDDFLENLEKEEKNDSTDYLCKHYSNEYY